MKITKIPMLHLFLGLNVILMGIEKINTFKIIEGKNIDMNNSIKKSESCI